MTQLKENIVGTGTSARDRHLQSYQELSDKFKLVVAFNRHKTKALDFTKIAHIPENKIYDNVDKILKDSNVGFIDALPPIQLNVDIVNKAVKPGNSVLLEEPFSANFEQAKEIVRLTDSSSIPIDAAEIWLYLPYVKTAKEQIKRISPAIAFTHNFMGPFVTYNKYLAITWRLKPKHVRAFLSDGKVHQLVLASTFLVEF